MTGQLEQAEAIFFEAIDKSTPRDRSACVAAACAGNPALLKRVLELLAAHEEATGPLHAAPLAVNGEVAPTVASEQPGTMIGPYKLLEQIGEGGFGIVFMAEQHQPIRRKVALKILKPGMDTRQVVARFEAERQALALMDHPHIAHI